MENEGPATENEGKGKLALVRLEDSQILELKGKLNNPERELKKLRNPKNAGKKFQKVKKWK